MFTDRQWRNLVTDIHDGQVAAVVGPELSVLAGEPGQPTLYRYLASELVRRLHLEEASLPQSYSLLQVSNLYLADRDNDAEDLHREVRDILQAHSWPVPDPLRRLVAIRDLNLFVSTTFDSLLADALNNDPSRQPPRILAYSENAPPQSQDVAPDFASAPKPTVFHLFGKFQPSGDYALTEERILEYSHRLQSSDRRPTNLFDLLRTRRLLILGCSLPGWLARFILRASKGDGLLTQGARGSVVADAGSCADSEFAMFLDRRKVALYAEGDAVHFVRCLHARWAAEFPAAAPAAAPASGHDPFKPESVFLSYANEDLEMARQVSQALDQAGVDVWFDKLRLEAGDDFRLVIEKNIENCSCFVPLISCHTTKMDKRFFQREWNKAIDEAKAWPQGYPFIQPLLIDDTPVDAPGIPIEFRKVHARRMGNLAEFIEDARKRIRERRLGRRSA